MTIKRTVCLKCGEHVKVPKDFRKNRIRDPRLVHLEKEHNMKWHKGIFSDTFRAKEPKTKKAKEKKPKWINARNRKIIRLLKKDKGAKEIAEILKDPVEKINLEIAFLQKNGMLEGIPIKNPLKTVVKA